MTEAKHDDIPLVRTTCADCGVVEVPLSNVVLRVDEESAMGVCVVRCPLCAARMVRPACDTMMTALVAVGVEISLTVPDHGPSPAGALTHDEIERFVDSLQRESELVRLVQSEEPPTIP